MKKNTRPDRKLLRCPECTLSGRKGKARIGNNPRACPTCNSFKRRVERAAAKQLRAEHKSEYKKIYASEEKRLYYELTNGLPEELITEVDPEVGSNRTTEEEGK